MQANRIYRSLLTLTVALLAHSAIAEQTSPTTPIMQTTQQSAEAKLKAANDQFYNALNAMFVGEIEPMRAIWSHQDDVTLMSPFGGRIVGWDAVGAEFLRDANLKLGGQVVCKDLLVHTGSDIAYTTCVEAGENIDADGKPVHVYFRATNIFRLEDGEWKLLHHHTDTSKPLQESF